MSVVTSEVTEGSAIPAPPPPPVHEVAGDDYNPSRSRVLYKIWDIVAIFGPIRDVDLPLKGLAFQSGGSWRAYLRQHPTVDAKAFEKDASLLDKADRWLMNEEIKFGLKNGYLKRDADGLLVLGTCPPEHTALSTVGGESGVRDTLLKLDNAKALEILTHKTNPARMKPTRAAKAALKKSLEEIGQLDQIRMWQPPNMGADPIVINGQTRKELLESMGVEPRIEWLPKGTTAVEALLQRIHHEIHATTKSQTKEDRDAYIAELAAQGVKQEDIAKQVGLSRNRVSAILSQVSADGHLRQKTPTLGEVEEWNDYVERGWSYRDIAEFVTGWSKDTIQRHVVKYREGLAAAKEGASADAVGAVMEEIEQEKADEVIDKAIRPSKRPKTPEARRRKAKEIEPYVEAAEKAGLTPSKVLDIAENPAAIKVIQEVQQSLRSEETHEHIWVCRDCGKVRADHE